MIIEYRARKFNSLDTCTPHSEVLRTYKDVTTVQTSAAGVTYLRGTRSGNSEKINSYMCWYDYQFLIAAINLAPGEYLEVVDLPRD